MEFDARAAQELWQRWKAGESLSDIGRALGVCGLGSTIGSPRTVV